MRYPPWQGLPQWSTIAAQPKCMCKSAYLHPSHILCIVPHPFRTLILQHSGVSSQKVVVNDTDKKSSCYELLLTFKNVQVPGYPDALYLRAQMHVAHLNSPTQGRTEMCAKMSTYTYFTVVGLELNWPSCNPSAYFHTPLGIHETQNVVMNWFKIACTPPSK
mmetsp:Transcript_95521/g.164738  ORF Transcript_95521/g.164738 Transcript_95521/m.164738 type:complete len:162 (+) Transcript_95521:120-605(+)